MAFLFIIISIGFAVFNIYQQYKKETEQAKKRFETLRKKNNSSQSTTTVVTTVDRNLKKTLPQQQTLQPLKQKTYPNKIESHKEFLTSAQRKKLERKKLELSKDSLLEPIVLSIDEEPTSSTFKFDLRDAVIQSVILERPKF